MEEYLNGIQGVRGSSPLSSTIIFNYLWFNLATPTTVGEEREGAVKNRDRVAEKMTSEDIAEAQRLAGEWKPQE